MSGAHSCEFDGKYAVALEWSQWLRRHVQSPDSQLDRAERATRQAAESAKRGAADAPPASCVAMPPLDLTLGLARPTRIVICCSLYLAGHELSENG